MSAGKRCLLVVDDEDDFRLLFRHHFQKRGYHVLEAGDGVAALEVFATRGAEIDLVVTDIRMPKMNGEQLIRELRARRRFLPIVGVTGQADLHGKLAFLDEGAYYYLDKPVEHWGIVERLIDNAIRLHLHEEEIELNRQKEREIARLLRAYILKSPRYDELRPQRPRAHHHLALEIAIEPVEIAKPSGDYVEWFERDPDEVVFYVADASGHNDLVASFTACLSNMVLHRCHHGFRPSVDQIIFLIDQALDQLRAAGALSAARYLTFFIGCIDLTTGVMTYVNAGHPEALLFRAAAGDGRRVETLRSTCQSVGHLALFQQEIKAAAIELRPGDLLFIYTDGASDLLDDHIDPRSGIKRLITTIEPWADAPAATLVAEIKRELFAHAGPSGLPDDTTLLAIRVNPPA